MTSRIVFLRETKTLHKFPAVNTQWCKILGKQLNVLSERRADGEWKHARRRIEIGRAFHALPAP